MFNAPRLVSLFSGCGGMDVGFEKAGFERVFANDFDKDAQAIFKLNLGDIDGRDIRDVPVEDIPDCDILTAGFPCQPFSNAGNRKGVHDSRGMLYQECLRIIDSKKPKVMVFENVKGLMSSKYVDGRKLIDVIAADLDEIGYAVTYEVVDSSNYEVPQRRQRLILVGVRKDLGITFVFPEKIEQKNLTLEHILNVPEELPFGPSPDKSLIVVDLNPKAEYLKSEEFGTQSVSTVPFSSFKFATFNIAVFEVSFEPFKSSLTYPV